MKRIIIFLGLSMVVILSACTNMFQSSQPSMMNSENPISGTATGLSTSLPSLLTPFIARGTEPFWAFEQTATGAKFSQPSNTGSGIDQIWYTSVESNSGTSIIIMATPVTIGLPIGAILTPGTCSDGMSDIVYLYTVALTYGTGILSGCAN